MLTGIVVERDAPEVGANDEWGLDDGPEGKV
jgi:hypothetical protein